MNKIFPSWLRIFSCEHGFETVYDLEKKTVAASTVGSAL